MKDKKTAITQPIPESGLALLRPVGDLIFWQAPSTHTPSAHTPSAHTPSTQTEASLCELVKGADAVLCFVADLIHSLKLGKPAGAALDVFEFEPKIPAELLAMPDVICLPHVGSATLETRSAMARLAAANVIACLENREPPNPVNQMPAGPDNLPANGTK